MKLLSIRLSDVRRFTTPVRIDGIGPGLNVLTAPNENGKSTLFDALQALFFQPHRSKAGAIMALKPHAGGAPEVSVEVATPDGQFRLSKRWLSKPMAEIHQGARLIAKADEAEAWIAALIHAGSDGGPAGLLWVRQGVTGLDQGSGREQETARGARRDLMSSVTGEVEALTGGRRMDRALALCHEELDKLVTTKGKSKSGGPLAQAEDAVAGLTARQRELSALAARLRAALDERREARRTLDELQGPEARQERAARLAHASAAHDTALRHAEKLDAAKSAVTTLRRQHDEAKARLSALARAQTDLEQASAARDRAAADLAALGTAREASATDLVRHQADATTARAAQAQADATLQAVLKSEIARNAQTRRQDLAQRIAEATALDATIATHRIAATTGPTPAELAALEKQAHEVEVLRALRRSSAPDVSLTYFAPAGPRASLNGADLADGETRPIPDGGVLDLPGFGRLTIRPGRSAEDPDRLVKAEAALSGLLAGHGVDEMADARKAAARRAEAQAALTDARTRLSALAPQGLGVLKEDHAALPEAPAVDPALPDPEVAQDTATRAAAIRSAADAALDRARHLAGQDREAEARATATAKAAADRLTEAAERLAGFGDPETVGFALTHQLQTTGEQLAGAERTAQALREAAPDLSACAAALLRARSVVDSADTEISRLTALLAGLNKEIELSSGAGVEEDLADVTYRLEAAEAHLRAHRFEVEVLNELARTLDAARATARDRYFEPVMTELKPLLRLLWPDADMKFDGDSILPTALIRNGTEEPIGVLSGGTQEQIALLVRLAFAQLLARSGRPAPILLDDAMVYTDDDRIERMFDALHRQASDVQIIVLSCRQRAFRDLGGQKLTFTPALLDA